MTTTTDMPRLQKGGSVWELFVDGKSYHILGAELQNSSMSSARHMDTVWQNVVDMGIDTVLGAVAWEDIEPEEGRFDFTELYGVIAGARAHSLRLVILWFGSFKNVMETAFRSFTYMSLTVHLGRSSYAPSRVKTHPKRFPRMYLRNHEGRLQNSGVLSIFHDECINADAKAFSKLLQHLHETDKQRTVIMVQVENKVSFHGDSRDRSDAATRLFESPVPAKVLDLLSSSWDSLYPDLKRNFPNFPKARSRVKSQESARNWEDYLRKSIWTDEIFMAYYYALYLEKIASSGQSVYDIPLFTTALASIQVSQVQGCNLIT